MHWTQIALAAALALFLGAFALAVVSVRRPSGANVMGHDGGNHLAASVNGIASLVLLVAAIAYAIDTRSVDWFGHITPLDSPTARGLGMLALVLSGVCLISGLASLGRSFRVALLDHPQPLITHGVYGVMRNPQALSVDLLALGVLLLAPSWLALAGLLSNVGAYEWKIRIEETYLRETHGAAYAAYCARTGRYLPRWFKKGE